MPAPSQSEDRLSRYQRLSRIKRQSRKRRALLSAVNVLSEPERAAEPRLTALDRSRLSQTEDEAGQLQRQEVERAASTVKQREDRFIRQGSPAPLWLPQPGQEQPFSVALTELMLCVGDWPAPRPDSVALLEPVLAREVTALARRACAGPQPLGRRLDTEHLLWATRRDPLITARILGYLEVRNLHSAMNKETDPERIGNVTLPARCREFCAQLGVAQPVGEDTEAAARRTRLDRLTRAMSGAQYDAFAAVRSSGNHRMKFCRPWLEGRWPPGAPLPGPAAFHVLLFLLRDMVALLVDACLLVRAEGRPDGPGLPTESVGPEHVREAVRRLQMTAPPRADMLLVK